MGINEGLKEALREIEDWNNQTAKTDTTEYIVKKYNIDLSQPSPFYISAGRYKCLPTLFNELGFKIGAEIGVHRGQYSEYLCKGIPGLKLYCIDLWESYSGYKDFLPEGMSAYYKEAQERLRGFDCVFLKEWSDMASRQFADGSLDFVYIDGNHAYDYVTQDIMLWSRKVRSGGIIAGHDFDDYSKSRKLWNRMNVMGAVTGWCNAFRIHPWFVLTNNKNKSWMYVK